MELITQITVSYKESYNKKQKDPSLLEKLCSMVNSNYGSYHRVHEYRVFSDIHICRYEFGILALKPHFYFVITF